MNPTVEAHSNKQAATHWLWLTVLLAVVVMAATLLLLVVGALRDPTRSLHAMLSSSVWTTVGPHIVLACLAGTVLSGIAYRYTTGRLSIVALVLASAALVGASAITFSIVSAVNAAGGVANPISGLLIRSMTANGPDHVRTFATVNGEPLRAALYTPQLGQEDAPVMLYIHGGGFKTGSFLETDADLRWFAERGWLVFSVEYRLFTDEVATWDLAANDVACAAAWISDVAANYGGNMAQLAVLGDSAGGNLAINYAYRTALGERYSDCHGDLPLPIGVVVQYPAVDPLAIYHHGFAIPGFEPEMLVTGYLGGSPYTHPERVRAVSSYTYLTDKAPATLIISPVQDSIVPSWSVLRFADHARLAGVDIELVRVPFANHVYNQLAANSLGNQARRSLTERFLNRQMAATHIQQ